MTAILYNNKSDSREINKNLTELSTINITLYLDTNVINPVFKLKNFINNANYMYVPDLHRYYYINNYTISNQCVYLHCSVDVLTTYKTEILNSECLISRSENDYNDNIVDTLAPITESTVYAVKNFGENIKTTEHFIIGVI